MTIIPTPAHNLSSPPRGSPAHRLELNLSRWPVIEVTNPKTFANHEWDELINQIVRVLKCDLPFAMINDVRVGPPPSAQQRKAISTMYQENITLVKKNWLGTAVITSSSLVKGAVTALNWLMPPPHPVKVCASYQEGEQWAFAQAGVPVFDSRSKEGHRRVESIDSPGAAEARRGESGGAPRETGPQF